MVDREEGYKEDNRNSIILSGIMIILALFFYTVYPPTRTAVGIYFIFSVFSLAIYSIPRFGEYLVGIGINPPKRILNAVLIGGGITIALWLANEFMPGFAFGLPFVPYSVSEDLRFIIICLFAPIAEELATRGALMGFINWAQKRGGLSTGELWIANILQAIFFTIIHATAYQLGWYEAPTWMGALGALGAVGSSLLAAFTFGILLGWIVSLNGKRNLLISILAHFGVNLILFTQLSVAFGL